MRGTGSRCKKTPEPPPSVAGRHAPNQARVVLIALTTERDFSQKTNQMAAVKRILTSRALLTIERLNEQARRARSQRLIILLGARLEPVLLGRRMLRMKPARACLRPPHRVFLWKAKPATI